MTDNQIKAEAVNEFVTMMIGAFESGFVDKNNPTLAEIHQVARHHIKDKYGIETPSIVEQWGEALARDCGLGKASAQKNQQLQIERKNDALRISIGTDLLCHALSIGRSYGAGEVKITDKDLFISELVRELHSEEEDGTTLVHRMLDSAVTNAIESGAEGIEWEDI